jgi:hypothetical protein
MSSDGKKATIAPTISNSLMTTEVVNDYETEESEEGGDDQFIEFSLLFDVINDLVELCASAGAGRGFGYKLQVGTLSSDDSLSYRVEKRERTTPYYISTLWPEALKENSDSGT